MAQLATFLASWAVLHFMVFKPYLGLLEERRSRSHGLLEKAEQARQRAVTLKTEYENFMKGERKVVGEWVETEKRGVLDLQKGRIQKVRDEAANTIETAREQVESQVASAQGTLKGQIKEFSSLLVSKLLAGGSDSPSPRKKPPSTEERAV